MDQTEQDSSSYLKQMLKDTVVLKRREFHDLKLTILQELDPGCSDAEVQKIGDLVSWMSYHNCLTVKSAANLRFKHMMKTILLLMNFKEADTNFGAWNVVRDAVVAAAEGQIQSLEEDEKLNDEYLKTLEEKIKGAQDQK